MSPKELLPGRVGEYPFPRPNPELAALLLLSSPEMSTSITYPLVGAAFGEVPGNMICDGPFVNAAMEVDDDEPYFVRWIGNSEVCFPHKASVAPADYRV